VLVTAASVHDTTGGKLLLDDLAAAHPTVSKVWADGGYQSSISGYSIDARMKSGFAVTALESAVARRGEVAGCTVHSDRGSQFRSGTFVFVLARHEPVGSMRWVGAAGDNTAMQSFFALLQKNVLTAVPGPPARNYGSQS
jgi:transposase InsO family protein